MRHYQTTTFNVNEVKDLIRAEHLRAFPNSRIIEVVVKEYMGTFAAEVRSEVDTGTLMPTDKGVADLKSPHAVSEGNGDNTDFTPEEVTMLRTSNYPPLDRLAEAKDLLRAIVRHFDSKANKLTFDESLLRAQVEQVQVLLS
jgi:hypothetical protein